MVKSNKAAFELSVSTIIIIVIGVTFLILGLALLRNIFQGSTQSIDDINSALGKQVQQLFADESKNIIVYLNDKTAKIKAGTVNFNFWIAAQTTTNLNLAKRADITYTLELDQGSDCSKQLGSSTVKNWFSDKFTGANNVAEFQASTGFAKITLNIPSGTVVCTQTVYVTFKDNTVDPSATIGGTSFTIQVLKSGLF